MLDTETDIEFLGLDYDPIANKNDCVKEPEVNNCLDCRELISCTNKKAIAYRNIEDIQELNKLELFLNKLKIPEKRNREIVCARIVQKIKKIGREIGRGTIYKKFRSFYPLKKSHTLNSPPLVRSSDSIPKIIKNICKKIKKGAIRAKREIKKAIFSLFLNERFKLIFRVCNYCFNTLDISFLFLFSIFKRSFHFFKFLYPEFLSFGNRFFNSKFVNYVKKIIKREDC